MAVAKKSNSSSTIDIQPLRRGRLTVAVVGETSLICNRISEKAKRELLLPKPQTNKAGRSATLKHDPLAEFRASPYIDTNDEGPTLLHALAAMFKRAMSGAALDMPGATKAEMGRLMWVEGERVSLYGIPQLYMTEVRNSDVGRTPDIRTRAIVPQWACHITINFVQPNLTETAILNLLAAAGIIRGIGDDRPEKGHGTHGMFSLVDSDDERFKAVIAQGGRAAQVEAMGSPTFYDQDSEDLFLWYEQELKSRGLAANGSGTVQTLAKVGG